MNTCVHNSKLKHENKKQPVVMQGSIYNIYAGKRVYYKIKKNWIQPIKIGYAYSFYKNYTM